MIPPRTTSGLVQAVMAPGGDYDTVNNPDLTPFIKSASSLVDKVVAEAKKPYVNRPLTDNGVDGDAELVERWLAAHFYCMSDQTYASRSTGGASGSFRGQSGGDGLMSTNYGRTAVSLDYSGCLRGFDQAQRVRFFYAGTPACEQTNNESGY